MSAPVADERQVLRGLAVYLGEEMYFDKAPRPKGLPRWHMPIPVEKQYLWVIHAASNQMCLYGRDYDFVVGVAVVHHDQVHLSIFVKDFEKAALVSRQGALASYRLFGTWAPNRVWVLKVVGEVDDDGC